MAFVGAVGLPYGLSLLGLAGPPYTPSAPPLRTMPSQSNGWIAHVYTVAWVPKSTFAVAGQLPSIQASLNGGLQPITVAVPRMPAITVVDSGDIILISEQGGDGIPVYGGIVEDFPDTIDTQGQTSHGISISPFVAELTDTGAVLTYTQPTEVAQMVRDALRLTSHCQFNFETIPDTGAKFPADGTNAIQFQGHVADVLNTALLMAGPTYCWFCDERGMVWFQPMGSVAEHSVRRGADYNRRQGAATPKNITNLKNYIEVVGGVPSGESAAATGVYSNVGSQATYGMRRWDPPPTFPTIADSNTLNDIAANLGSIFDRRQLNTTITLPSYDRRVALGRIGGPTIRFWEPTQDPQPETEAGAGTWSSAYIALTVTTDGPQQVVNLGDLPYNTTDDQSYLGQRILQRQATEAIFVPSPTLSGYTVMQAGAGAGIGGGRLDVVDQNNRTRAQFGNLSSYTDPTGIVSAAEYGMRSMDASGNLLFDSAGLVGVMQVLAFGSVSATLSSAGVTGTASFTLNRQSSILILTPHTVTPPPSAPGAVAETVHIYDNNPGLQGFSNCSYTGSNPGFTNGTLVDLTTLSAGSHSVELYAPVVSGGSFQFTGIIVVFLLGG